jgi:hypothetical protein
MKNEEPETKPEHIEKAMFFLSKDIDIKRIMRDDSLVYLAAATKDAFTRVDNWGKLRRILVNRYHIDFYLADDLIALAADQMVVVMENWEKTFLSKSRTATNINELETIERDYAPSEPPKKARGREKDEEFTNWQEDIFGPG